MKRCVRKLNPWLPQRQQGETTNQRLCSEPAGSGPVGSASQGRKQAPDGKAFKHSMQSSWVEVQTHPLTKNVWGSWGPPGMD